MLAMAGTPKARLRDLTSKLQAAGIDPATLETTPAPHVRPIDDGGDVESLRAHARTRARAKTETRPMAVGPATRHTVDARTSDDLEALARQMRPNLIARIERLRPTWAAGWIEDYPIDTGELGELLAYVRDEHGGSNYKITILSPDQSVLYTSRIPIAGMPRKRGRELPRARWDGADDEPGPRAALRDAETREPRTNGTSANDLAALVTALGGVMGGGNRDHVLEAVREMTQNTQRQTSDLIAAVLATRSAERQSTGLVGQLREVVQATAGIRELREALAEDAPPSRENDDEGRSGTSKLLETAATELLRAGIANDAQRRQQPPQERAQRPQVRMRPVMRRPPPEGSQPPPTPRSA